VADTDDAVQDREDSLNQSKEQANRSRWLAVLSSKSTHQFVRIVPPEMGLVVKLDYPESDIM